MGKITLGVPHHSETEQWLSVAGYVGLYRVSSLGRVWSYPRCGTRGGFLRGSPSGSLGHLAVCLYKANVPQKRFVHQLVLEAFAGPCPAGSQALHGLAGPFDNSITNLRWGTPTENCADKLRDGTLNRGETHGMGRLTDADVLACRQRHATGEPAVELAAGLGVTPTQIGRILDGSNWSHLEGPIRPPHSLSADQVVQIRSRLLRGERQSDIARAFGVDRKTIWNIKSGRTWGQLVS